MKSHYNSFLFFGGVVGEHGEQKVLDKYDTNPPYDWELLHQ